MESKKRWPTKVGEMSEIVDTSTRDQSGFGAYMLLDENLPEEWKECIKYLNEHFAPNLRIIVKDVQPWYDYKPLGSLGWKVIRPIEGTEFSASEVLNGWESETR